MALFNRKKTQTISELEDYYANKRNRSGMAWLMAFLSLLITVLVIAALFFGGRWLYRTISDSDNSTDSPVSTVNTGTVATSNDRDDVIISDSQVDSSDSSSDTTTSTSEGTVSDEAASTSVPNTATNNGRTAGATTTPPSSSSQIPNTGAGELIILAPLIAVIAGYLFSRNRQIQR